MYKIKKKQLIRISDELIVNKNFSVIRGVDSLTSDTSIIITFNNLCNDETEIAMSVTDYENPKFLLKTLKNKGFTFLGKNSEDENLANWLSAYNFDRTFVLTPQTGWYINGDKYAYALPHKTYGKGTDVKFYNKASFAKKIKQQGEWDEYQKLLQLAECSPVIIFAFGVGLAAFLIKPFDLEIFGVHIFDDSTAGKTTATKFPTSFFSHPNDYNTWLSTLGGFEKSAMAHNGRPLILDELKMVSSDDKLLCKTVTQLSYALCTGKTKERSDAYIESSGAFEGKSHFTFISNGEFGIINKAQECGYIKDSGEKLRLIDVPARISDEYGIFSYIPKPFKSAEELVLHMEEILNNNYGFVGAKYAKKLVKELNSDDGEGFIVNCKKDILEKTQKLTISQATGYTKRYTRRFAITHIALNLAQKWGIVPWSKETIRKAIELMYSKSVECIETDEQLLNRGIAVLKKKIDIQARDCIDLTEYELSKIKVKEYIKGGYYFFDKINGKGKWIIPSATFKNWFLSEKVYKLVLNYLADLLPTKTNEGYPLTWIGAHRARAIVLNKKQLKELLSK